ncbi:GNAT family protein [Nocardioides sp.]|uniref:GNAT family N-acetyltransferase n=1 Tax=Nocardioides sp. TaxID=35761 RepID=UPI0031FE4A58|nr:GCN5-related N-acetyltransferase [Nocardioides sp.]
MPTTNAYGQQVGDEVPGWVPRCPPVAVLLPGRYVQVEPLSIAHAQALYDSLCGPDDPPLWTYRPTDPPEDPDAMGTLIEAILAAPDLVTFALVPVDGSAAGLASYTRIDPAYGQAEVAGVLYARSLQRTRAATEVIRLMAGHVFDDLGYRRFEWKCDSLNEASRRAAVRLGFCYEGRFRNHMVTKGLNRDTDWFSITDAEWPDVRTAYDRWLDLDNFDADGRQRTALSDLTKSLGGRRDG